jgi:SAM-dependent methyltransferase
MPTLTRAGHVLLARAIGLASQRAPAPLRTALLALRAEVLMLAAHQAGVAASRRYAGQRGHRLNLGCGDTRKPGWINVDVQGGAVTLDLRRPLPFDTGSCVAVYSEHFLEHLDYPDPALGFLTECYRVLAQGGCVDIGVPDTEWPLLEYAGVRHDGYFATAKAMWHPKWCQTRLEHINYHFRQDTRHRFAWDWETLAHALELVGFRDVQRRPFNPDTDTARRQPGTLYVRACRR